MKKCSMLILIALASVMTNSSAQAQYGLYGGQCGMFGGWGGYYDIGRLYQVLSQNVPYYSAFPPVYYSMPVPRTYGYSPFAYPPGIMTPEVADCPVAQEITNPYVEPTSTSSPVEKDRVTHIEQKASPQVIANPYVQTHMASRGSADL